MAEAFLNKYGSDKYYAESAGIEPGKLNPLVVKVMAEVGIDISGNTTKSVFDFVKQSKIYDYVVTVCDTEAAERCPVFPGKGIRLHWGFPDPSKVQGSENEKLSQIRNIRDEIEAKVRDFIYKG